jgi:hypothetical protein
MEGVIGSATDMLKPSEAAVVVQVFLRTRPHIGEPRRHSDADLGRRRVHQTGGRPELPSNIVLLPLPVSAPELNPMESVWEYLRGNKLSARVWDDYDAILEACGDTWNWLIADPERIRSIGTREWLAVNV